MTLAEKIAQIKSLESQIQNHPMTLKFYQTPRHYCVLLPAGSHPMIDMVRAEKANNKGKSLERLLAKLEKLWKESWL